MLKQEPNLLANKELPPNLTCGSNLISADNAALTTALVGQLVPGPWLPTNSHFELHPYKGLLTHEGCDKFIIGTFPPISYLIDQIPGRTHLRQPNGRTILPPLIPFYHGNLGSMWNYLFTAPEIAQLDALDRLVKVGWIINKLAELGIFYDDIINYTQRKIVNGSYVAEDDKLFNICSDDNLVDRVMNHQNVAAILFNTSRTFSTAGLGIHRSANRQGQPGRVNVRSSCAFDLFIRTCQELNLKVEIAITQGIILQQWTTVTANNARTINRIFRHKIAFNVRLIFPTAVSKTQDQTREFIAITPFSPAAVNRGTVRTNRIVANWILLNPGAAPSNFLHHIYQQFRNGNYPALFQLNQ